MLLLALALYAPSVALQGFVNSMSQLVGVRVLLGAVSAAIASSVAGISADRSVPGNRARVMGINTFSFALGVAIGPLLGGFLTDPWPPLAFLVPATGALGVIVLVWVFVPSDRRVRRESVVVPAYPEPEN